jgi:type VI secretion system secreted protein VgrG
MKRLSLLMVIGCLLSTLNLQLSTAFAQGTAFTYQGRLNNNGSPANGNYDIAFTLYSASLAGTSLAGPVTNTAVVVTNGLFTTLVDFGNAYTGTSNWLQIAVSTNGANAFSLLSPRQQLTPVPYAIFAADAVTAASAVTATTAATVTGNITDTQLSANIPRLNGNNGFTGPNTFSGTVTAANGNNLINGTFTGGGSGLTNLNASQLVTGVVSNSVLPGFQGNANAIGGGVGNAISGQDSAILGGLDNTNNANQSSIGGGGGNLIQSGAYYSFIGGGGGNLIQTNAYDSFIGSGYHNTVQPNAVVSVVGGGQWNTVQSNAPFAVIGGGLDNTNTAPYSTIPGGYQNLAGGKYGFAAGQQAQATNQGAFVWADSQNAPFASTNNDSFNVRAQGGVNFMTSGAGAQVDGVSVLTAAPGSINGSEIDDGGSSAYQSFQQIIQPVGGDTTLAFSNLTPIASTNGATPGFSLTISGSAFGSVIGFSGCESMSQPYAYAVEVTNTTSIANLNTEIGKTAVLTFSRNGRSTTFGGIVTGCALAAGAGASFLYTVQISSVLSYMALTTDYQIYLNQSATTVAQSVYQGDVSTPITLSLNGSYEAHPSLTQFKETDLNFFNRILENEGIFYFFNQSVSPPGLIVGDYPTAYLTSPNSPFNYFGNGATNGAPGTEYIQMFQRTAYQLTHSSVVKAVDFTDPDLDLLETVNGNGGSGSYFEFGNAVATTTYDTLLAGARQGLQTESQSAIAGSSTAPDLRPGYTFSLTDQTGAGLSGNYLVTSVHHAGFIRVTNGVATCFYGNEFEVIPAAQTWRPPLKTPIPQAQPCTAEVTGASGDEIDPDEYGRVKVLFHWDRHDAANESSSAWVPVAGPWAGNGHGMIFIPRVGDEVLVSFIGGDPDQPVITGSLYNADNPVPYALPENKTQSGIKTLSSTGGNGFNELRFEDKSGGEEVYLQAQKDFNVKVLNNLTQSVGNNETKTVTGTYSLTAGNQINLNSPVAVNGGLNLTGILSGDATGLTNLQSADLIGALPAISGASLTGLTVGQVANAAALNASQTFTGVNYFDNNFNVYGSAAGGFNSALGYMENFNTSGSTAPTLRLDGYGNSPNGVLSVSSQGTGLLAQFGNGIAFVADIQTNGTVDAGGFNGGSLRVGTTGTTFNTIQSGQAIMPSSSTVETNFSVIFPQPFSTLPKIIASISGDPTYPSAPDTFAMSIRAITSTTGFTVNVVRVDAPSGWSQQLRINWQAWQ